MTGSSVAMPSSDHVRDKRRRRRDEILHAALTAFRETGYHSTTLADIADRLGIRKTALYHYFPDKEAILFECHRQSLAELERLTAEAQELDSAVDRLHFIIREHVRVMTDTLEGSPLAFEVTSMSEERQAEIIEGRDRYEQELRSTGRSEDRDVRHSRIDQLDRPLVSAGRGAAGGRARDGIREPPRGRTHLLATRRSAMKRDVQ
jgi:AcrR family transcriptional regulator